MKKAIEILDYANELSHHIRLIEMAARGISDADDRYAMEAGVEGIQRRFNEIKSMLSMLVDQDRPTM